MKKIAILVLFLAFGFFVNLKAQTTTPAYLWNQCWGLNFPTNTCEAGSFCYKWNEIYGQCVPDEWHEWL